MTSTFSAEDYLRLRDFEFAQPLYDLAFILEYEAAKGERKSEKYRSSALFKAAYKLDGYSTSVDRWLSSPNEIKLDLGPSVRIAKYLKEIKHTGYLSNLGAGYLKYYNTPLKLRTFSGLGSKTIAKLCDKENNLTPEAKIKLATQKGLDEITLERHLKNSIFPWQAAHVVPPLLRLLLRMENNSGQKLFWSIEGIENSTSPINKKVKVYGSFPPKEEDLIWDSFEKSLDSEKVWSAEVSKETYSAEIRHILGFSCDLTFKPEREKAPNPGRSAAEWIQALDPLADKLSKRFKGDLHLHTIWSDGNATPQRMIQKAKNLGVEYLCLTEHSRSRKLQGGMGAIEVIRQNSLINLINKDTKGFKLLKGIEVDILSNGDLDLPSGILKGLEWVIGSVHSHWGPNREQNTHRVLNAIHSGLIDAIGHPTSMLVGKPGVPNYYRKPADLDWDKIFETCSQYKVALEVNCFPARLDLNRQLMNKAIEASCQIVVNSDAHATEHLNLIKFGAALVKGVPSNKILNTLSFAEFKKTIKENRKIRAKQRIRNPIVQMDMWSAPFTPTKRSWITAKISSKNTLPTGPSVIGIDLTASKVKPTGMAKLDKNQVEVISLSSDEDILNYIKKNKPEIVSIDSPLGLPGGGKKINGDDGIVRQAERDLSSIGISAYPALIPSMKKLTLRGIRLKNRIAEEVKPTPEVIESYPGAAQDLLSILRKQEGLDYLREGLRNLKLKGPGLETESHDEMDAITAAIVGRYYYAKQTIPMGVPKEAQLIVPVAKPVLIDTNLIIVLCGPTASGKSLAARYLATNYGFNWIKTRNIIAEILVSNYLKIPEKEGFQKYINKDPQEISNNTLKEFGEILLHNYHQNPFLSKLKNVVKKADGPIVIDAARSEADIETLEQISNKIIIAWFIQSSDKIRHPRLDLRQSKEVRKPSNSLLDFKKIDARMEFLRECSQIIENEGSLENLRWALDDNLFSRVQIQ